jgi:3-oxoadipate CoA-transferase alpha subunit
VDKVVSGVDEAISDIGDGASIMVGGFGESGLPKQLIEGLIRRGPRNLTIIHNGASFGRLIIDGHVDRLICSFPVGPSSRDVLPALEAGSTHLDVIPQGTLVERIRAGGAGLGGVLTPVGVDLEGGGDALGEPFELDGRQWLLLRPLRAQFALLRGDVADRAGNVRCRKAARNFTPVMATAADVCIVEVRQVVEVGELDPEDVHIPGPFIDRVVVTGPMQPEGA